MLTDTERLIIEGMQQGKTLIARFDISPAHASLNGSIVILSDVLNLQKNNYIKGEGQSQITYMLTEKGILWPNEPPPPPKPPVKKFNWKIITLIALALIFITLILLL